MKHCLCFKPISDHRQQAIFQIKDELKAEFTNMFRDAIDELKQELKSSANQSPSANLANPTVVNKKILAVPLIKWV